MNKTLKKTLSIIITILMIVSTVPFAFAAETVDSGTCGDNVTWTLDSAGVLTISGTGAMKYYGDVLSPFGLNTDITTVVIEDGVTNIDIYAFYECTNLASVTIGNSVTSIGDFAFLWCESLKSIEIPNGVTSIGERAFYNCTSLASVTIGNSVTSIGDNAFIYCRNLGSVSVPCTWDSENPMYVFEDGVEVTVRDHTAPETFDCTEGYACTVCGQTMVEAVDAHNFENGTCKVCGTKTGTCGDNLTWSLDSAGVLTISGTGDMMDYFNAPGSPFYNNYDIKTVVIKNGVTSIGYGAFADCTSLASVTIGNGVTSIGDFAFFNCKSLASVTIGDGVTSIGEYAFGNCTSLASVTIPNSVTSIGERAFSSCSSLASVTIPDSVTSIGKNAFYGCTSLTLVHYLGTSEWWGGIEIGSYNDNLTSATRHYCTEIEATVTCTEDGNTAGWYCADCEEYVVGHEETTALGHTDEDSNEFCDVCGELIDAKVLTAVDGILYIDGVKAQITTNYFNDKYQIIPDGKYKLEGNITTDACWLVINAEEHVILDLNGYTWDFMEDKHITSNGSISVYDTSADETGKIISTREVIFLNQTGSTFNLYGGTVETTDTRWAVDSRWGSSNLYGGKIKSNGYAIYYYLDRNIAINLDGTVLETGEGYAQIRSSLRTNAQPKAVIDVTDYKGGSLTADIKIADTIGKLKIFEGIKNAEEAEKYTVNVTCDGGYFFEKEEYDEATGDKYIYIAKNAFTQQPTADNNFTVNFNNPAATFQWCEVEETVLTPENVMAHGAKFENGKWIIANFGEQLFTYDIKAGDILKVSTESDFDFVILETGVDLIWLENGSTSGTMTFDSDATLEVWVFDYIAENPVELEFSIIKETALDGETGKTLQNPECEKSYYCKVTAGGMVYTSDVVNVNVKHDIVIDEYVAPTCTETGLTEGSHCEACGEVIAEQTVTDMFAHKDDNGDYKCDYGCGHEFEKPVDPTPDTPDEPTDTGCDHLCHKSGFVGFIWKIVRFLYKFFNIQQYCDCGVLHYDNPVFG